MYLDLRLVNLVVINMDKDTVVLSLKDYNGLRDFRNEILKGKIYTKIEFPQIADFRFWSKDECLDNLEKARQAELKQIKQMSYWEFRKWKKSN